MNDWDPEANEIFLRAAEAESDEIRAALLDEACHGDSGLRTRVEALLVAHFEAGSFLESPPPGAAFDATNVPPGARFRDQAPGDRIGPYTLLQKLGEGGMGTVWAAKQLHPVRRRVALKLIKAGMDSAQMLRRFEAERQALALMDHANIAKVFDAGSTSDGRPFFAMELVKGVPITKYCDDRQLTLRQRLKLFLPVCHAVQHAHQKGIIHRDLKPSNVLVAEYDDLPVPKVIDFGVAKAAQKLTEESLFTEFGQVVGTLEYMSPEQAKLNQLDIDTRSDVYSLGVLLYELLAGCTPFDGKRLRSAAFDELLRIIREEEPLPPSSRLSSSATLPAIAANRNAEPSRLSRALRGELDWIVMKAIEKDRNRRYETTYGLARDIERYLNDEPVQACPPSTAYRLRKFARRNLVPLAAMSAIGIVLVIGAGVSTWQAIRATNAEALAQTRLRAEERARRDAEIARDGELVQRRLAENNASEAESQRLRAEANFGNARRAVDEYLAQVTESELLSVPGLQPLRESLLRAALKFYFEFTRERGDDPTLLQELASAHHRLAEIEKELGNTTGLREANLESIRLYEKLRNQGHETVELQAALAAAYFFAGRVQDTVTLCQTILKREPRNAEIRSLLGDAYNSMAVAEKVAEADSLKLHQQAFDLRESLAREFPDNPDFLSDLGSTVNNLGVLLHKQGRVDDALQMFRRAADYASKAYELSPHSIMHGRGLCTGLRNVAVIEASLNRPEALQSYERLVDISRKRAFENPAVGALRGELYRAYLALGRHQNRLGATSEGARSFRLAGELLEQIPRETPDQLFELSLVYAVLSTPAASIATDEEDDAERARNADLAMATLRRATDAGFRSASALATSPDLEILRERKDFQSLLSSVQQLAEADKLVQAKSAGPAQQLASHQEAAGVLKALSAAQPDQLIHRATLASTLQSIGVIQTGLKQYAEAEQTLAEASKLREALLDERENDPLARADALSIRAAIGRLNWERDQTQAAHGQWQEILAECEELAANHEGNEALQKRIAAVERAIAEKYSEAGLCEYSLLPVERGLRTKELFDSVSDCQGALLLAAGGRLEEHQQWSRLIAAKWGKTTPAHAIWAATMNPRSTDDAKPLTELADRAVKAGSSPLWKFKAATAWYRAGEFERALELMVPAKDLVQASTEPAYLYWFAMVYRKLGQQQVSEQYFEKAEKEYHKAAKNCIRSPAKTAVRDAHGGSWWTWIEGQAARRAAWTEFRGENPLSDPWTHLIRARALQEVGDQKQSAAELAIADAQSAMDVDLWKARAHASSRFEDAEKAWARALQLSRTDPLLWIDRGRWYAERGVHEKADADLTHAATLIPDELNKFLEAGWWVTSNAAELSTLFPAQAGQSPAMRAEASHEVSPVVVPVAPFTQMLRFRDLPNFNDVKTAYAMTLIYSPHVTGATLLVGGTNEADLRLNDKLVYRWNSHRSPYTPERVPVLLRAGRNTLVAEVRNPAQQVPLFVRIADNPIDRGLELAQFGLFNEAVLLLRPEFVKGSDLDPHVWNFYSGLLLATGDVAGYRKLCEDVLTWFKDKPGFPPKLHVAAICTLAPPSTTDIAKLVQLADEGVADANGAAWARDYQMRVYLRAGRYREVLNWAGSRAALRALCRHHLGEAEKARSELAQAELDFIDLVSTGGAGPLSAKVFGLQHGVLDLLGDYLLLQEARSIIAPEKSENDEAFHFLVSQTRRQFVAADPRLLPFEKALLRESTRPRAWLDHGRAQAELGNWKEAQADFAKAAEIAAGDPEVLTTRALIYAELNRLEEAVEDLKAVWASDTTNGSSTGFSTARNQLFEGFGQSPQLFERTTRLYPNDPAPWVGRSRYLASISRWPGNAAVSARGGNELADLNHAISDLREAVARGFRDFDQPKKDVAWQILSSHPDFGDLVRDSAQKHPNDFAYLAKLDAHTDVVRSVASLPDGRLVSIGRDKEVRVWDPDTLSETSSFTVQGYLRDADVTPDGRFVALASNLGENNGAVHVWDLQARKRLCELNQPLTWTNCVRISPDGKRVVTSGHPPRGVLWDVATAREVARFDLGGTSPAQAATFSPDGERLALGVVGRVRLFDGKSGDGQGEIRLPQNRAILDLSFNRSGQTLACGQTGGHFALVDLTARPATTVLHRVDGPVNRVRFLNQDRFVLCASDATLELWDVRQRKIVATANTVKGTADRMAVSRDGRYAYTAGGEQWDQALNKPVSNGEYAIRIWQLPKHVWTDLNDSSSPAVQLKPPQ